MCPFILRSSMHLHFSRWTGIPSNLQKHKYGSSAEEGLLVAEAVHSVGFHGRFDWPQFPSAQRLYMAVMWVCRSIGTTKLVFLEHQKQGVPSKTTHPCIYLSCAVSFGFIWSPPVRDHPPARNQNSRIVILKLSKRTDQRYHSLLKGEPALICTVQCSSWIRGQPYL